MRDRRIIQTRLRQTRQQRSFFERKLLGRLAEIKLRGSFKTIDAMAQVNLIGIEGKDLRLGKTAFDLYGQ